MHTLEEIFVPVAWAFSTTGVKAILITDNLQHSRHGFLKFTANLLYIT